MFRDVSYQKQFYNNGQLLSNCMFLYECSNVQSCLAKLVTHKHLKKSSFTWTTPQETIKHLHTHIER